MHKHHQNGFLTGPTCQIHTIPHLAEHLGTVVSAWQFRNLLRRMVKRRVRYLLNMVSSQSVPNRTPQAGDKKNAQNQVFVPGDLVRVKSREEIQSLLDRWNQLKGCSFMAEMQQYCGTTQRVLKRVNQFLDERDYRVKRCKGIYLLEGVICPGTIDFGSCDRSCYFFWREEWLEKQNSADERAQ